MLGMGKGFYCSDAVRGHDLGDLITRAYERAVSHPVSIAALQWDANVNLEAQHPA